ncbi:hypothetical protein Tsubulata_011510 [Turnera subulata]|uniref:DUF4283 domain-containing protein n=1 Tax=Turnera subulata TaxID=218843 RepID=A0A9Q0EZZ2_9ROSI|nr:hypothetical protein Tsubulata_011510 [Turnera subulata]
MVDPARTAPLSFKDKLVAGQSSQTAGADDDFMEQPDDIVSYHTPEGPVVKISDRYRDMLHKRWANTLIVKLWGRNIGFRTLCNRLPNLWKLKKGVRVVDLDHNFYFVWFTNRQDYLNPLNNGPWIVFEHFLTVEPWKLKFDPESHKITSVVAWVQISGLTCEYYDRKLLNTHKQRFAKKPSHHDGRPTAGPGPASAPDAALAATGIRDCRDEWMVAAPRHRRPRSGTAPPKHGHGPNKEALPRKETSMSGSVDTGGSLGSRFDVLQDYVTVSRPSPISTNPAAVLCLKPCDKGKSIAEIANNPEAIPLIPNPRHAAKPVTIPETLKPNQLPGPTSTKPAQTPQQITAKPGLSQARNKANTTKAPLDFPTLSFSSPPAANPDPPTATSFDKTSLTTVNQQFSIVSLMEKVATNHGNTSPMEVSFDTLGLGHKEPMELNPETLDATPSAQLDATTDVTVLSQAAMNESVDTGSDKFRRALKDMVSSYRPEIFGAGGEMDSFSRVFPFLQTLGYDGGAFVDPIGFSGGIWVVWKRPFVRLQVISSTRQFIHMSIHRTDAPIWFLAAIYASPTRAISKRLWDDLVQLEGSVTGPWLLAGDFNVSKRLDRALANAEWRTTFDDASVYHLPRAKSNHAPLLISLHNAAHLASTKPFRY